jgi:formate hydrogenlyase subunit 5
VRAIPILDVPREQLHGRAEDLFRAGGRMQMMYARRGDDGAIELRYLAETEERTFAIWRCVPGDDPPSLARVWPLLGWYERETADLYGLHFAGHPEPKPLVLPEGAADTEQTNGLRNLPEVRAEAVQHLPFGPVRADVLESAEFTFLYIGEQILHYAPHLFFKHRGMEQRFEGCDLRGGAVLAERISAVGSVAHALAYCHAAEAACACAVPVRAQWLRVLLAELERLYNHLHYLGHLCNTTTLKVGEAEGKLLEERAKQINARLTGSRFLRNLVVPGGLRRDLVPGEWLGTELEALRADVARYTARLEESDSHLDRLITTGKLEPRVAFDQGATGPVQRASGFDRDMRRDHPYAAYPDLPLAVPVREGGDGYARAQVRIAEIDASFVLMQRTLLLLPEGPVAAECAARPGAEAIGWSESPRGSLFYAVHLGPDGRLSRVKVKSPSFSNWRVFPFTVHDTNMMDYAINEATFGLTIAGCAR